MKRFLNKAFSIFCTALELQLKSIGRLNSLKLFGVDLSFLESRRKTWLQFSAKLDFFVERYNEILPLIRLEYYLVEEQFLTMGSIDDPQTSEFYEQRLSRYSSVERLKTEFENYANQADRILTQIGLTKKDEEKVIALLKQLSLILLELEELLPTPRLIKDKVKKKKSKS